MRRLPIDFVGLAAVTTMTGCAREFEPAQPWFIPGGNDDDGGEVSSAGDDDDGGNASSGAVSAGDDEDADADDGASSPPADDDGDASADGGGDSSESGAGETGAPMDSPYEGGWDVGACQDDIGPATNQVGGVLEDLVFTDQFGEQVRLYDFCHKAILIAEGAFW